MKIDNNYRIETDGAGCTLVFSESRERTKKDTKEKEQFVFEENYYYLNVQQCLEKYIDLVQEKATNVEECIQITKDATKLISSLFSISAAIR